jgi:hypothetical protein
MKASIRKNEIKLKQKVRKRVMQKEGRKNMGKIEGGRALGTQRLM